MVRVVVEAGIVTALAVWFVLSIPVQWDSRLAARIRSFDPLGLLPAWTFFAPNPGTSDYHLIFRDVVPDVRVSEWAEVPMVRSRGPFDSVWNPWKRQGKVLSDCVGTLARSIRLAVEDDRPVSRIAAELPVSVPYLLLLNHVSHLPVLLPDDGSPSYRQFAVVEQQGPSSEVRTRLVLCSALHARSGGS